MLLWKEMVGLGFHVVASIPYSALFVAESYLVPGIAVSYILLNMAPSYKALSFAALKSLNVAASYGGLTYIVLHITSYL